MEWVMPFGIGLVVGCVLTIILLIAKEESGR